MRSSSRGIVLLAALSWPSATVALAADQNTAQALSEMVRVEYELGPDKKGMLKAGESIEYELTIRNRGIPPKSQVVIEVHIPQELDFYGEQSGRKGGFVRRMSLIAPGLGESTLVNKVHGKAVKELVVPNLMVTALAGPNHNALLSVPVGPISDLPPYALLPPFVDVSADHWAIDEIRDSSHLFPADSRFNGNQVITRFMMARVITALAHEWNLPVTVSPLPEMNDVPPTHPNYGSVVVAVKLGVIKTFDSKFHGDKLINRGQAAVMLKQFVQATPVKTVKKPMPEVVLPDQKPGGRDFPSIQFVAEYDLVYLVNGEFHPDKLVDKYQLAYSVGRLRQLYDNHVQAEGN